MNKFICTGYLAKDVEKRETNNGKSVANFSIAVERTFSEGVDFFNVTVWNSVAETCAKYLSKGSKVGIVGSIQNRSYEANDGSKRVVTEIIAEQVEFLSHKEKEENKEEVVTRERPTLTPIEDNLEMPF